MKILHLSDLHFSIHNIKSRREKIISKIIDEVRNEKVDLIFFTGDLVFKGNDKRAFIEAKESLIDSLLAVLNVEGCNVIFCPGNHDVDRSADRKSVTKLIDDTINNPIELEGFVKDNSEDFKDSFRPLRNYFSFIKNNFKPLWNDRDHFSNFYTSHRRSINGMNVGVVSINTAWRALGDGDRGKLLFPLTSIDQALRNVEACDVKILLHHHPLSYLKEFNEHQLVDIIHNNFDIAFYGHKHRNASSIAITANDGIIKICGPATLADDDGDEIGFSFCNFDFEGSTFSIETKLFDKKNEVFYSLPIKENEIPADEKLKKQNKFRKTLRKKFKVELTTANDIFIGNQKLQENQSFLDIYTNPVLKTKSVTDFIGSDQTEVDFDIQKLIGDEQESDFLIMGKDKCGKTSLLKKIQLELLQSYSVHEKIPYYINVEEKNSLNLEKELQIYFETNRREANRIIAEDKIVLLLDNYSVKCHKFTDDLKRYLDQENVSVIAVIDETISSSIEENYRLSGRQFEKLYFHKLRKKHIRKLAEKWPNLSIERREEIVEKIESIFTRMSIPFNFWTVSLFLWIFKSGSTANFQNDSGLVDLYIESLLERDRLVKERVSFGFDKYKKFLAHFAYFLLKHHKNHLYSAAYLETITFTDQYLQRNPRNDAEAKTVWDYVEDRGIVKQREDGRYTFRLNGVFEYFLAYYMKLDSSFRNETINDENIYLAFSNEFELYAGFNKDDSDFLESIYVKTKDIYSNLEEKYSSSNTIDKHLITKIVEVKEIRETVNSITNRIEALSFEQQDELEEQISSQKGVTGDETEVKLKKPDALDKNNLSTLETSLKILGRVYKNVDEIDNQKLVYEIFDYIMDSACYWGFELIENSKTELLSDTSDLDENQTKELVKIISSFIPTLVQTNLYDIMGHRNLQKIIREKVKEFKGNSDENQYKLFILLFLLCDISFSENKKVIKDAIKLISIPTLQYSILLKLNYYYAFKSNLNKDHEKYLRDHIQQQQVKFDNRTDLGMFHQSLEETGKSRIKNKQKNQH